MRNWLYENRIYFLIAINFLIFLIPLASSTPASSKNPKVIKEVKEKVVIATSENDTAAYHVIY